jgi:poly(hydroxyalkanoate) depolymerase family esterase
MSRRPTIPSGLRTLLPARRRGVGVWHREVRFGASGLRAFDVYVPAGPRRRAGAPVVVLLHGCLQTPDGFVAATRFASAADRHGFLLVVPHQRAHHHPRRCWRWYEPAHQHRGAGEPAVLAGIAAQVCAERERWRADPRRVYVAGLSAGGAMALTLAATYPDVFAAAGVHSAPAWRSSTGAARAFAAMAGRTPVPPPEPGAPAIAPTVVVQGTADDVVAAANGERVVDQWLAHRAAAGPVGRTRSRTGASTDGRAYRVQRWYTARGHKVLELWLVDGLGHAWSGGRAGEAFSDAAGPRATTLMWRFFARHALDRRLRPARAVSA